MHKPSSGKEKSQTQKKIPLAQTYMRNSAEAKHASKESLKLTRPFRKRKSKCSGFHRALRREECQTFEDLMEIFIANSHLIY
jgi:hypothetical protein